MNDYESEFGDVGNPRLLRGFGDQKAYLSGSSTVSSPTKLENEYSRATKLKPTPTRQTSDSQHVSRQSQRTSETQEDVQQVNIDGTAVDHEPETTVPHQLRSPRSSARLAPGAESLGGVANIKDLARRNHELSAKFQAQRSNHSETEKSVWKKKYDREVESGKEKQAEIDRLRRELESTRTMVSEEKQNNWELQYKLQDALEEVSVLQHRLMRSIPARLQGQSRDDEEDENTSGVGVSTGLPWEKYENATIKSLRDKVQALKRDRDSRKSRH